MSIRPMKPADSEAVSLLSHQLGYPMNEETTRARIELIMAQPDHAAFVVESGGEVVGWIHLTVSHSLVTDTSNVEIAGLVVDERFRGHGLGKALVARAEQWTLERDLTDLKLRSATKRTEAHQFYQNLGFAIVKTQARFEKKGSGSFPQ